MIVDVWCRYGDFCGNESMYFYGQYECDSLEQAREIFPAGFVCGWRVEEHVSKVRPLPKVQPDMPSEREMEYGNHKRA